MKQSFTEERVNRQKLLKSCMDRGLSQSAILQVIMPMAGKTDNEKERIAADLLVRVETGEFDAMERTDYSPDRM